MKRVTRSSSKQVQATKQVTKEDEDEDDKLTVEELKAKYGTPINVVTNGGPSILDSINDEEDDDTTEDDDATEEDEEEKEEPKKKKDIKTTKPILLKSKATQAQEKTHAKEAEQEFEEFEATEATQKRA